MIEQITFTGADDSIHLQDLFELGESPSIEWGILISKKNYGTYRFPSADFLEKLYRRVNDVRFYPTLSLHVCGQYVRNLLIGNDEVIKDLKHIWDIFPRVQLNFHSREHNYNDSIFDIFRKYSEKEFIFQYDEVNKKIVEDAMKNNIDNCSILFDLSGGAGILPEKWNKPFPDIKCGYAGGLSPDNLHEQMDLIEEIVKDTRVWIDMETHIRSNNDALFDFNKVRKCIGIFKNYYKKLVK